MDTAALQSALDDTQKSLSAALARIEGLRIRERHLMDELAQLRQQVHGYQISQSQAAVKAVVDGASLQPDPTQPAQSTSASGNVFHFPARSPRTSKELRPSSTCSITIPQLKDTAFTAASNDAPLYVTSLTDSDNPVTVWLPGERGNEKVRDHALPRPRALPTHTLERNTTHPIPPSSTRIAM